MSTITLLPRKRKLDSDETEAKRTRVSSKEHSAKSLLSDLYDDPFCDMTLVCQDRAEIRCHRAILGAVSQKLRDLLVSHEQVELHLPDFSPDAVGHFLQRCYCLGEDDRVSKSFHDEVSDLMECLGVASFRQTVDLTVEPNVEEFLDSPTETEPPAERPSEAPAGPPDIVRRIEMATKCVVQRVKKEPSTAAVSRKIQPRLTQPAPSKSNESLLCWECGADFKSRKSLADHLKTHDGINAHLCISCDKEFPNQEGLNEHIKNHVQLGTCHLCPEKILTLGDLKLHLKRNHNRGDSTDNCEHCCFEGQSRSDLVFHYRRCHKGKTLPIRPKNSRPFEQRVQCEKCPEMVVKYKMSAHMQKQHDPKLPFECNFCLYRSLSATGIHCHETRHHYEQKHGKSKEKIPCGNNCGVLFTMESSMKWHMKRYCSKSLVKKEMIDREMVTGKTAKVRANSKMKRELDKKRRLELLDDDDKDKPV